jgi:hypothetical protein
LSTALPVSLRTTVFSNLPTGCEHSRVLLAHQGGWDEALFVAVPIAIFAVMLWVAKRRAEAEIQAQRDDEETE